MMVIAFSSQAEVLCPFERRKGALRDVIERIQPTDRPTQINEALKLRNQQLRCSPMWKFLSSPTDVFPCLPMPHWQH